MIAFLEGEDGPGWEYKVVSGAWLMFGNREKRQAVLAQEAKAGWQLAATLDDNRMILRRPVSAREQDVLLPDDVDPYRTNYGNQAVIVGLVVALMLTVILVGLTVALAVR